MTIATTCLFGAALLTPLAMSTSDVADLRVGAARWNIVLIAVDDLRPEFGAAGDTHMSTPSLDRLASEGRWFTRHYAQVPTCGASRFSMLTGLRPSRTGALGNEAFRRLSQGAASERTQTLPEILRARGYQTVGLGKISHHPDGRWFNQDDSGDGAPEMPDAWDQMLCPTGHHQTPWRAFFAYADGRGRTRGGSPAIEAADVPDDRYPDALIADEAIRQLQTLSRDEARPFFLAVGFFKPHLPFAAPSRYFDLYDPDALPLAAVPSRPDGAPARALHKSGELLGNYGGHPDGGVDEAYARRLRQGYFAAVSYVDAQIGRVLDAIDDDALRDRTAVILWGDHGWHLGDQGMWGKHTLFERALRSALIIRIPDQPFPGQPTDGIVESLDLFPTVMQLAAVTDGPSLDGESLLEQIRDPRARGKSGALGYWNGGRTLRTEDYRITEWPEGTSPRVELYAAATDAREADRSQEADGPVVLAHMDERTNIADLHPDVVAALLARLREESVGRAR